MQSAADDYALISQFIHCDHIPLYIIRYTYPYIAIFNVAFSPLFTAVQNAQTYILYSILCGHVSNEYP